MTPSGERHTDGPRQSSHSDGSPKPPRRPELERAGASDQELFLLHLRYRHGRLLEVAGNKRILLDDPTFAWVVFAGYVDVFGVPLEAGQVAGTRRHLFRAGDGTALFGLPAADQTVGLLISGPVGGRLLRVRRRNPLGLA